MRKKRNISGGIVVDCNLNLQTIYGSPDTVHSAVKAQYTTRWGTGSYIPMQRECAELALTVFVHPIHFSAFSGLSFVLKGELADDPPAYMLFTFDWESQLLEAQTAALGTAFHRHLTQRGYYLNPYDDLKMPRGTVYLPTENVTDRGAIVFVLRL